MTTTNLVKGSDLIPKALSAIGCDISASSIKSLVIGVNVDHIWVAINGGGSFKHCKTDNSKLSSLLCTCGYGSLIDAKIRSVIVNLSDEDVANVDINLLCSGK